MARKKAQAFRTITEVSDWLDTPSHVLRFWESKFPQIKPVKRAGGRRYYRPEDLKLIGGIKHLLHDKGTTIAAVKDMIKTQGEEEVHSYSAEPDFPEKGRRKKRKAAKEAASAPVEETQDDTTATFKDKAETPKEILTLDTEILPTPRVEPLILQPADAESVKEEPLKLDPLFAKTAPTEEPEQAQESARETSARDVISNAISRNRSPEIDDTQSDSIAISLDQLKSRAQIASDKVLDIEDLYFQLQRIRNRMKRRLETL